MISKLAQLRNKQKLEARKAEPTIILQKCPIVPFSHMENGKEEGRKGNEVQT